MPQVEPAQIKARAAELREAVAVQRRLWLESLVGQPLSVLAEKGGTGHAANFATVRLPEGTRPGAVIRVTPEKVVEGILEA
jgi:threonylcarbamoyladenosine tRNA methylthiotransferase MtaB